MSRAAVLRLTRLAKRNAFASASLRPISTIGAGPSMANKVMAYPIVRPFTNSSLLKKGILPETENPPVKETEPEKRVSQPTDITTTEYHEVADRYIDHLVATLEELQEEREDVDVEYSAGVLTLIFPPVGTYVINKQPPNRQIWLSSPVSGPKRYDWVMLGESQNQKEGGGKGEWVYLRDGSTLNEVLEKEIGIDLTEELDEI